MSTYKVGDVFDKRYRIKEDKKSRPDGHVYYCHDMTLGRDCYIKILSCPKENLNKNYALKLKEMGLLHHQNIERLHDVNDFEGHPYLSLEWFLGNYLSYHLKEIESQGRLHCQRVLLKTMLGVASALEYTHARGIVHGHINWRYIFVRSVNSSDWSASDTAVLAGFGLAARPSDDIKLRKNDIVDGGVGYLAPEQVAKELYSQDYNNRIDIWCIGATMYHLLAGNNLHGIDEKCEAKMLSKAQKLAKTWDAKQLFTLKETLDALETPEYITTIIQNCLYRDPEKRYSASDLFHALERAFSRSMAEDMEQLIWPQDTQKWFSAGSTVPHNWNPKGKNSMKIKSAIKGYLECLLGFPPPDAWFSDEQFGYLFNDLKHLIGEFSVAQGTQSKGQRNLSLGNAVVLLAAAFTAAGLKSRDAEWIVTFIWNAEKSQRVMLSEKQDQGMARETILKLAKDLFPSMVALKDNPNKTTIRRVDICNGKLQVEVGFENTSLAEDDRLGDFKRSFNEFLCLSANTTVGHDARCVVNFPKVRDRVSLFTIHTF